MLACDPPRLEARGQKIALDSSGETVFVSHAHNDHAPSLKKSRTVLASKATMELLKARGHFTREAAQEFRHDDLRVELMRSGHILGSNQLYAEWDSTSFVYSSDFKLRDSLTTKGAETRQCETLLMECTYGLPEHSFPDRSEVYKEIGKWTRKELDAGNIVLLGGYAVGKAQEIVKALNEHGGVTPLATKEIAAACEVYEAHGVALDFLDAEAPEGQEELKHAFAAVVPMHKLGNGFASSLSQAYGKRVSTAIATGWKHFRCAGKTFCLSDHADFAELLEYVDAVQPKKVFCTHGFAAEFAATLRSKGFDAEELGAKSVEKQATLAQY